MVLTTTRTMANTKSNLFFYKCKWYHKARRQVVLVFVAMSLPSFLFVCYWPFTSGLFRLYYISHGKKREGKQRRWPWNGLGSKAWRVHLIKAQSMVFFFFLFLLLSKVCSEKHSKIGFGEHFKACFWNRLTNRAVRAVIRVLHLMAEQ